MNSKRFIKVVCGFVTVSARNFHLKVPSSDITPVTTSNEN